MKQGDVVKSQAQVGKYEPNNRREYVRVPAEYPVIFRVVDPDYPAPSTIKTQSFSHLSSLLSAETAERGYSREEPADFQLREMIQMLDWKIHYLVKLIEETKSRTTFPYQGVILDISASGMRISTSQEMKSGASLEFELVLPLLPFREMVLSAKVLRVSMIEPSPYFLVGCSFEEINETDREQIIRYVLKKEMQLQREKRR